MSRRVIFTSHRPQAGLELIRFFLEEKYEVEGISTREAWPAEAESALHQKVLARQPDGLKSRIVEQLRLDELVQWLGEAEPAAIVHAPLYGRPPVSLVEDYRSVVDSTLLWLEAARQACPYTPFIFLSSSLVYGDRANTIALEEDPNRLDFSHEAYRAGITEAFPITESTHSVIGSGMLAADLLVYEYSRSYYLPTCTLRIDSLCDPGNRAEDRRDILSQIAYCCLKGKEFVVQGNNGKQVREIVPAPDVGALIEAFIREPQRGEIYNVGAGRTGSCSINEAIQCIETLTGKRLTRGYTETPPLGEPHCYYSENRHIRYHYPKWKVSEPWKKTAQRVVANYFLT